MNQSKIATKPRSNSAFKRIMSIHWIMFYCYIILFIGGTFMARLPNEVFGINSLYNFHKTMGVLTMGLLIWRILTMLQVWWNKYSKRLPKFSKQWTQKVILHTILYLFMCAVPISGFFLSNSYKSNNVHFLWITLPDIFPEDSTLVELGRSLHFWLAYTFGAFIILHAIDQRKFIQGLWRRMLKQTSLKLD
ncbi:MAG: cytochrome b [Symploca sp. SIO3C6]|uniref:Cytochrome b n=1 Tax=Symploca sp. SIO1C4 TaxID=2607765 RepID=A0A6B3NN20_9CYAN|nr:cytochrome b [Symploca sp. SIO3C6]NER30608.1 cytochrome b [Symploca sp. SIO1C4]